MEKSRVLALATCFNRKEKTQKSLQTLINGNPGVEFDFIIVDDNSADGTSEMLQAFPNVTTLHGNGSLFYSGGMRLAIEAAKKSAKSYDFCMFFNDDVDFFEHSIEKMIALKTPERDIIVGATCDSRNQLTYAGVVKLPGFAPKCRIIFEPDSDDLLPCETFNANCVLIDYSVFMALDNIDPVYSHAMGDYDYGFAASRAGYRLNVANFYCGVCEETTEEGSWRDNRLSRRERFKRKNIEKGTPNKAWFHYLKKNYNIFTAIVYSITPYVRILLGL